MKTIKTVYVGEQTYKIAERLITTGEFGDFSEVLNYSLRFTADLMRFGGIHSLPSIDRTNKVKANVRVHMEIVDILAEMNVNKNEMFDFAILTYADFRNLE